MSGPGPRCPRVLPVAVCSEYSRLSRNLRLMELSRFGRHRSPGLLITVLWSPPTIFSTFSFYSRRYLGSTSLASESYEAVHFGGHCFSRSIHEYLVSFGQRVKLFILILKCSTTQIDRVEQVRH